MKTTRIFLLSASMLAAVTGVAEETSQGLMLSPQSSEVIPPAPSSAQQVRYQSPQPALSTGAVNLSVPLYTLEAEGLAIPFTLSYHTSGIKPTDDPLPCGYGWSLMPGLKVTRTVRGRADELFDYWGDRGGEVADSVENSYAAICSDAAPSGEPKYSAKRIDTEKDIFNISLPSGSHTRILVRNGNTCDFVGGGDNNETVITGTSGLYAITAKDAEGYVYCFGSPYETYRSSATNMAERRTAWALQYIELPSGRRIEFTWTVFDHDYQGMIGGDTGIDSYKPGDHFNPAEDWTHSFGEVIVMNDGQYRDRIHLSKVVFPGGEIELSYTDRKLSTFKVYSSDKSLVSSASLAYGTSAAEKNLLKSVTLDRDNRYSFDYNPLWDVNGRPLSSLDWWGYYNGKSNVTLTPFLRIKSKDKDIYTGYELKPIGSADRSPDEEKMKAGIIRRITYPTGGYSDFSYEAHRFPAQRMNSYGNISDDTDPELSFGGGLRVASISTYERSADPRPHVRRYTYDSVQVAAVPSASSFVKITKGIGVQGASVDPDCYFYRMVYVGYASNYMANRIGDEAIWYRQVTETYPEGKKVYSFNRTLPSDLEYREWGYDTPVRMGNIFSKGARLVRSRTYASESGGGYRPVLTEQMSYETVKQQSYVPNGEIANTRVTRYLAQMACNTLESPDFINGEYLPYKYCTTGLGGVTWYVGRLNIINSFPEQLYAGGDSPYRVDYYTICLQSDRLKTKKVTQHLENGDFTVTDTYSYKPGTSIITFVETKNPAGSKAQTVKITYPSATGTQAERDMLKANMTGVPVKTQKMYGSMGRAIRREFANFGDKVYRPVREWQSRGTTEWPIGSYDYDSYGNLREYAGTDSVTVAYLWGYSSTYPVYSIRGSDYAGVCRTNTSEVLLGGSAEKAELTDPSTGGNRCLVTRALWKPLVGMKSLRQPCGLTTGYEYDYAGRLVRSSIDGHGPTESYSYHVGTTGPNYMTRSVYSSATSAEVRETVNYDGLGREKSRLTAAPESGYTAVLTEYDAMDRAFRQWSPVKVEDSHPEASAIAAAAEVMYGTGYAYATTFYEASPMQRVSGQLKAGEAWHSGSHSASVRRLVNDGGTYSCASYTLGTDMRLTLTGSYAKGALTVEETVDEDGITEATFTDFRGRTVMRRRGSAKTYYVYNDYGDLCYILPPNMPERSYASNDAVLTEHAYIYRYDSRGRLVYSKIPGCDASESVYDNADRLVAETDADLGGKWRLHFYDGAGREVLVTEAAMQMDAARRASLAQPRTATRAGSASAGLKGYNVSFSFPADNRVTTAAYYDDYTLLPNINTDGAGYMSAPAGLQTGLWAATDDGGGVYSIFWYDSKGRKGYEITDTDRHRHLRAIRYTYAGQLSMEFERVYDKSTAVWKYWDAERKYGYDSAGRLEWETAASDSCTAVIRYTYDAAGRLSKTEKGLRKGDSGTEISSSVTRDYAYDVHGWKVKIVTGIPMKLARGATETTDISTPYYGAASSDVIRTPGGVVVARTNYTETIHYADGAVPRYNGTPSARDLTQGGRYDYRYDALDRLVAADYTPPSGKPDTDFSTEYTYDILSRPTSIKRHGVVDVDGADEVFGLLDNLTLTYDGATLSTVKSIITDETGRDYYGRTGFANGTYMASAPVEYNDAGRLVKDTGRMLSLVRYNTIGLPVLYSMSTDMSGNPPRQERSYDATGMKRRQTDYGAVRGQIAKTADRRYMESFTFNADTLERIEFNGGYFDGQGKAHFLFTDWQGNVTITTDAGGRIEQHTGYYPYGEPWREPAGQHAKLFAGKERVTGVPGGDYDFGPRGYRATTGLWDSWDIHAADYAMWSPWMYCGGNPVRFVDPTGNAWKRVQNEDNNASHFEWVKPQDSYDKNGNLLPGLYEQAILFTKEGSKGEFNPSSKFNIGTSTAIVHLGDGTTKEYDACTYPSDIKKSATIPEGSYEAAVGKHKGDYTALRMSDIGTTNFSSNSIELGEPNPSNSKTTKAAGVNIHRAGKNNLTGTYTIINDKGEKETKYVSEGCFLIDRNKWDDFISNFNTTKQKNNIIGISVER